MLLHGKSKTESYFCLIPIQSPYSPWIKLLFSLFALLVKLLYRLPEDRRLNSPYPGWVLPFIMFQALLRHLVFTVSSRVGKEQTIFFQQFLELVAEPSFVTDNPASQVT